MRIQPINLRHCNIKGCDKRVVWVAPDGRYYCQKHADTYHPLITKEEIEVRRYVVYFVATDGIRDCRIKIGKTGSWEQRFSDLKAYSPLDLRVIGLWDRLNKQAMNQAETQLHNFCAEARYRGEWFYLKGPVRQVVRLVEAGKFDELETLVIKNNTFVLCDAISG